MHDLTLRRPEEPIVAAPLRRRPVFTTSRLHRAASLLAARRRVKPPMRKRGAGLGSRCGRDGSGAGARRSRAHHQKEGPVNLVQIITLIATVLVASGVSSRLLELIKNAG